MDTQSTEHAVRDVSTDSTRVVVLAHLAMAPDAAYAWWIEPEHMARWWAPELHIDPRPGGTYRASWPAQDWHLGGDVLVAEPGRRLVLTWRWEHEPDRPVRTVEVDIEPSDGGTRLRVTHGTYTASAADQAERGEHLEGWLHFLRRLVEASV
jgi:uncharacterized protein YndB with AHSA1/START domain